MENFDVRYEIRRILRNYFGNAEEIDDCATEIEKIIAERLRRANKADRYYLRQYLVEGGWILSGDNE